MNYENRIQMTLALKKVVGDPLSSFTLPHS